MKMSNGNKSKLYISVVMVLIAILALGTGTYAWFTLSLSGKVNSMELQVTAGEHIRIDVENKGNNIENWTKSEVTTADIERQLGTGNELSTYSIRPVTSGNGTKFYLRSGTEVTKAQKAYLDFDLWFMSTQNTTLYLTEEPSKASANDGTKITSASSNTTAQADIVNCIRLSFANGTATKIYEPNKSGSTTLTVNKAITDAGGDTQDTFTNAGVNNTNASIVTLTANTPKQITVRVWLEGDDAQCDDDVKDSKFLTQLRFEGV